MALVGGGLIIGGVDVALGGGGLVGGSIVGGVEVALVGGSLIVGGVDVALVGGGLIIGGVDVALIVRDAYWSLREWMRRSWQGVHLPTQSSAQTAIASSRR